MTSLPALVLAAGQGTRLDPLTRLAAKAAVPLGGRTLIEHVLDWVRDQGVVDVVVNLHHLPATITSVVGDGAHLGLSVRYSWEQPLLGSAGGPRRAVPLLASDEFLIVNGDTLCAFDVAPMIDAHLQIGADVTMAVVPNPNPDHYNGLVVDDGGVISGFRPRGQAAGTWHFIGVQVARSSTFADLPDGVPSETVAGFYRDLIRDTPGRIRAWHARAPFLDVGTPRDYLRAALRHASTSAHTNGRHVVIWPDAHVAEGADLGECIVAGPVHVPSDFRARSSILVPEAVLRAGDRATVRDGIAVFELPIGPT
jgi:NDP-sugar pyrophosphorylase family protein